MAHRCIRIHKETLYALGTPPYVQFLVNPDALFLAILGSDKPLLYGTANKVNLSNRKICAGHSIEFYSKTLLDKLMEITGQLRMDRNYLLTGEVDRVNRVAYFSLRSLEQVERRTRHG